MVNYFYDGPDYTLQVFTTLKWSPIKLITKCSSLNILKILREHTISVKYMLQYTYILTKLMWQLLIFPSIRCKCWSCTVQKDVSKSLSSTFLLPIFFISLKENSIEMAKSGPKTESMFLQWLIDYCILIRITVQKIKTLHRKTFLFQFFIILWNNRFWLRCHIYIYIYIYIYICSS
jgi:hypothetical protein